MLWGGASKETHHLELAVFVLVLLCIDDTVYQVMSLLRPRSQQQRAQLLLSRPDQQEIREVLMLEGEFSGKYGFSIVSQYLTQNYYQTTTKLLLNDYYFWT